MKLGRFGVVSGLGWLMDFGVFTALVTAGVWPAPANVAGALLAITFVFAVSTRRVFQVEGGFAWRKFATYLAYQAVQIALFSALIQVLTLRAGLPAPVAKMAVTPVTFYTNFLFMSVLLTGRLRFL